MKFTEELVAKIEDCLNGKHQSVGYGSGTVVIRAKGLLIAVVNDNGNSEQDNENRLLRTGHIVLVWRGSTIEMLERILSLPDITDFQIEFCNNYCRSWTVSHGSPYSIEYVTVNK